MTTAANNEWRQYIIDYVKSVKDELLKLVFEIKHFLLHELGEQKKRTSDMFSLSFQYMYWLYFYIWKLNEKTKQNATDIELIKQHIGLSPTESTDTCPT